MPRIRFDRLSRHDRPAEPVVLGVPIGRGVLTDPGRFAVRDGDAALPCQTTVTSTWDDGSIRWLLARFLVDLPGNAAHGIDFAADVAGTSVRVPFMVAIAVNALQRYAELTGDDTIRQLIVDEVGDMLEQCVMPDGRFFYKQLPSLNRRLGSPREMEALGHAWEISGDRRFLRQLFRMMMEWLEDSAHLKAAGSRPKEVHDDAIVLTGPGPKGFAMAYPCLMVAYRVLSNARVLGQRDYPPLSLE